MLSYLQTIVDGMLSVSYLIITVLYLVIGYLIFVTVRLNARLTKIRKAYSLLRADNETLASHMPENTAPRTLCGIYDFKNTTKRINKHQHYLFLNTLRSQQRKHRGFE